MAMSDFFTFNSGPGPQTPLDRSISSGEPPDKEAEEGLGTDAGLQTDLGRPVTSGSARTGMYAMGTDSGLTTPVP